MFVYDCTSRIVLVATAGCVPCWDDPRGHCETKEKGPSQLGERVIATSFEGLTSSRSDTVRSYGLGLWFTRYRDSLPRKLVVWRFRGDKRSDTTPLPVSLLCNLLVEFHVDVAYKIT